MLTKPYSSPQDGGDEEQERSAPRPSRAGGPRRAFIVPTLSWEFSGSCWPCLKRAVEAGNEARGASHAVTGVANKESRQGNPMRRHLPEPTKMIISFLLGVGLSFGIVAPAFAINLDIPGFSVVNTFSLPAGVPAPLGDVTFSADGNTLLILGGSEGSNGGIWAVPVTRDTTGTVTALGAATQLFAHPFMDTSYEQKPGTDTFFFRRPNGVGERRPDGTIVTFNTGAAFFGGLAFIPEPLPNAGDLTNCRGLVVWSDQYSYAYGQWR